MDENNNKHTLVALTRFTTQIAIAACSKIPPWIRIVVVLATEAIDSTMLHWMGIHDFLPSKLYGLHDKINDLIGYTLCIALLHQYKLLPRWTTTLLIGTITYRTLQIPMSRALPAEHHDFSYAMFPDVFKELLVAIIVFHMWMDIRSPTTLAIAFVIIIAMKASFEYAFHVQRRFGR